MNLLELYIQGGGFMHPILILLIFGLAISLERVYTLSMAAINNRKFLKQIMSVCKKAASAQQRRSVQRHAGRLHPYSMPDCFVRIAVSSMWKKRS